MAKRSSKRRRKNIAPGLAGLVVRVSDLTEDSDNARHHPEDNVQAIKRSLARFGQQKPIIVDGKGKVIAGNGTLQAARALGWTHVAAVKTDLAEGDQRGFAIADNQTALLATWDGPVLEDQLARLEEEEGITAAELGFDWDVVSELGGTSEVVEEFTPTVPERTVWIFMGVPVAQFGLVQDAIEKIEAVASVKVDVVRDGQKRQ